MHRLSVRGLADLRRKPTLLLLPGVAASVPPARPSGSRCDLLPLGSDRLAHRCICRPHPLFCVGPLSAGAPARTAVCAIAQRLPPSAPLHHRPFVRAPLAGNGSVITGFSGPGRCGRGLGGGLGGGGGKQHTGQAARPWRRGPLPPDRPYAPNGHLNGHGGPMRSSPGARWARGAGAHAREARRILRAPKHHAALSGAAPVVFLVYSCFQTTHARLLKPALTQGCLCALPVAPTWRPGRGKPRELASTCPSAGRARIGPTRDEETWHRQRRVLAPGGALTA
jgi:hypothetical protein